MKKFIFIIIIVIICAGGIIFMVFNNKINSTKREECLGFTGGGFELVFNTNGGNDIDNMHVCIACSPDYYEDLPIPIKDGYTFDGWYYDKDLKNEVEGSSSFNVNPERELDENGCHIGYKDINLYAKWNENL